MANYSFQDPDLPDGSVINSGNFTQLAPNTEIMVGKVITINGGNFTNVKKDPNWIVNGGNWTQINRCSHNWPDYIQHGLAECGDECEHMISKEEITIDGVLVDTLYTYEDGVG
jgi:hypothetical protein